MKYLSEYRHHAAIGKVAEKIHQTVTRRWTLMEVCGGQTHSLVKYGLQQLLPDSVELVHGPGCPVCVTPAAVIDQAIALAGQPQVIFCSFGDMLRVPGSAGSLLGAKAQGADIRMVYSPTDALQLAQENPSRQVVFFAVGFETTAPATAMAVYQAGLQRCDNFSVLVAHFLVPPAIAAICQSPSSQVQGFLAPGHVCAISGLSDYFALAQRFQVPIVVAGFEPLDLMSAIYRCLLQLESGQHTLENDYTRVVSEQGNATARQLVGQVFKTADQQWRGITSLESSGLALRDHYRHFDAGARFGICAATQSPATECISGEILQGLKKPRQCPHFGQRCKPESPLGAPMVSSEGACAAYFQYQQDQHHDNARGL